VLLHASCLCMTMRGRNVAPSVLTSNTSYAAGFAGCAWRPGSGTCLVTSRYKVTTFVRTVRMLLRLGTHSFRFQDVLAHTTKATPRCTHGARSNLWLDTTRPLVKQHGGLLPATSTYNKAFRKQTAAATTVHAQDERLPARSGPPTVATRSPSKKARKGQYEYVPKQHAAEIGLEWTDSTMQHGPVCDLG
jgi:hypothetical protein